MQKFVIMIKKNFYKNVLEITKNKQKRFRTIQKNIW